MMLELTKNIFALSLIMSGEKRYYETVSFDSIGDLVLVSFVRLQNWHRTTTIKVLFVQAILIILFPQGLIYNFCMMYMWWLLGSVFSVGFFWVAA